MEFSAAAAAATLEFHLSSSATTHTYKGLLWGKNAPKFGIRKRSEIAIFKTLGFEQVPHNIAQFLEGSTGVSVL
jgi:hypothetical protein